MKGLELVWRSFESFGIVEYGIIVYTDPLDLVLKLAPVGTALEHLLHLPFWFLVIDNWEWRIVVLSG
jgi:hypothetical protein